MTTVNNYEGQRGSVTMTAWLTTTNKRPTPSLFSHLQFSTLTTGYAFSSLQIVSVSNCTLRVFFYIHISLIILLIMLSGRPTSPEIPERQSTCSSNYQWICKFGTNVVSFRNTFTANCPVANQLLTLPSL